MHKFEDELKIDPSDPEKHRWFGMRQLWNDWDPIGVVSEDIQDEYDSYVAPTLKLLDDGCPAGEIEAYLTSIVRDYIGLGEDGVRGSNPWAFARKIMDWYEEKKRYD